MLDWTTREYRYFARLLSPHALLYTEMVTCGAILHGDRDRHLAFHDAEHPVALQLGGSDPKAMAECARIAEDYGYDEVNINVGCPSDRVQNGTFGACLMATPEVVAEVYQVMDAVSSIPVTVKHRIGIDDQDSEEDLERFISTVAEAGCHTFIVHARKAWLQGLSPKENREVPPLDYERVYRLKQAHPDLTIVINGGIRTFDEMHNHLKHVDGVMVGREAYQNPYLLADVGRQLYDDSIMPPERLDVVRAMFPFIERHIQEGGALHHVTRHMLGLFHGQRGAKGWRRHLSENAWKPGADLAVLEDALRYVG